MVNPAYTPEVKAMEVRTALASKWRDKPVDGLKYTRDGQTLVFEREPAYVFNKTGEIVGVDAWVRLFDKDGNEVPIDNHRIIINTPLVPRSGIVVVRPPDHETGDPGERTLTPHPENAFVGAIWDSVLSTPASQHWQGSGPFKADAKGTVTTVYAGTADDSIQSRNTTYATARTGGTLSLIGFGEVRMGQRKTGSNYDCFEAFYSFDTSAIPDGDIVSAVAFGLYGQADVSDTDFTINARTKDWGASVTTADWVSGASLSVLTLLATYATSNGWSTSAYNTFVESGTDFQNATNIKTGTVYVMCSSSRHQAATVPTADEYVVSLDADTAGTTQDPKLDITHAGPSAALTGTITASVTEADIVAGGKTLIITLTNDTWIAAGAASFDLQRDEIIAGCTSAQSEATGFNLVPKVSQSLGGVVRTNDNVVTITWDAFATYNITAQETITVTVPSTAVVAAGAIVATPTFTVAVSSAFVQASGAV